jgi:hypothetical protein
MFNIEAACRDIENYGAAIVQDKVVADKVIAAMLPELCIAVPIKVDALDMRWKVMRLEEYLNDETCKN